MAYTFFGEATVPTDSASATGTATQITITPPGSMQAGDLVYVRCWQRGTATFSVGVDGGQTWSSLTRQTNTNVATQAFWCVFDGTWDADPRFDYSAGTNTSAWMAVFRPTSTSYTSAVDTAETTNTFAAAATVTITGHTRTNSSCVTIASWTTADDNTWGTLTGTGWSKTSLSAQVRNTSGSDMSSTLAYNIGSGATNNVSQTQLTLGNDAGVYSIISFYEYIPTRTGTTDETLGAATCSAAGTVAVVGTTDEALGAATCVSAAAVDVAGTLSKTLGAATLASAGTVADAGTDGALTKTLGAATCSSSGAVTAGGTLSKTLYATSLWAHNTWTVSVNATYQPATGRAYHTVTSIAQASNPACIYYQRATTVAVGDQFEYETTSNVGGYTVSIDADGIVSLTGGSGATSFEFRFYDLTTKTWGTDITYRTATLSKTLGVATLSAETDAVAGGTLSKTLGASTLDSDGAVTAGGSDITGELTKTLGAATASAAAGVTAAGTLSKTLGAATGSGAVGVTVAGSLSKTLGAATLAAETDAIVGGTLSKTLTAAMATGAGTVALAGTLSKTLGAATCASAATVALTGSLSKTLGAATCDASDVDGATGSLSKTLGGVTISSRGAKLAASVTTSLVAESGWSYHDVSTLGQANDPGCIYYLRSAGVGDQVKFRTTTDTNAYAVSVNANGIVTVSGTAPDRFSFALYDTDTNTWGATLAWTQYRLSATLGGVSRSLAGGITVRGSLTKTLAAATCSATGIVQEWSVDATLGAATLVSAGQLAAASGLNKTLGGVSRSAAGTVALTGSATKTLGGVTRTITATAPATGALSKTLGAATLSAAGLGPATVTGSLAKTLGGVSIFARIGGSGLFVSHPSSLVAEAGWFIHNVTDISQADVEGCIYKGLGVTVGDQFRIRSTTLGQGWAVSVDAQGYITVDSGGSNLGDSFTYYVWDNADKVWGSVGTITIDGAGVLTRTLGAVTISSTGIATATNSLQRTLGAVSRTITGSVSHTARVTRTLGAPSHTLAAQVRVTGTLNPTLGTALVTGAAQVPITGTLSKTLAATASDSAGRPDTEGVVASTLGAATLASAATQGGINGTVDATLPDTTSVSAGTVSLTGSLAKTLASPGRSLRGGPIDRGGLDKTLGAATLYAFGVYNNTVSAGTLNRLLAPITLSSTATVPRTATLTEALDAVVVVSEGTTLGAASLVRTLGAVTCEADGVGTFYSYTDATTGTALVTSAGGVLALGTLAASLDAAALSSAGAVDLSASLSLTLDPVVTTTSGSSELFASLSQVLSPLTLASVGIAGRIEGALGASFGAATLASAGEVYKREATLDQTLGGVTLLSDGIAIRVEATLDKMLDGISLAAATGVEVTASFDLGLGAATLAASGAPATFGSVNKTLGTVSQGLRRGQVRVTGGVNRTLDGVTGVFGALSPRNASLASSLGGATLASRGGKRPRELAAMLVGI